MAKETNLEIKKQLDKKLVYFLKYFPVRIKNVGEDAVSARNLIWGFKDAKVEAQEEVAQMTAEYLKAEFGNSLGNIVFVCVPASTQSQNEHRYGGFCKRVCELTNVRNGFPHVRIESDRLAAHEHRHDKTISKVQIIDYDKDFFFGKDVIVMDDVITTGTSYAMFANQLEDLGANVLGGVFLGRTHYRYK